MKIVGVSRRALSLGYLALKSAVYRTYASALGVPGLEFDAFGRRLGLELLYRGDRENGFSWLINPVKIVRYFEFDFARRSYPWESCRKMLDVSSPRLLSLWLGNRYPDLVVHHINPDKSDTETTKTHLGTRLDRGNIVVANDDATALSFPAESFDAVTSLSVIEHIPGNDDSTALKEMWRVLRPNGRLILTFPFLPKYWDEYFSFDQYGLYASSPDGQYFASRYYDEAAINSRIYAAIGVAPKQVEIFGELEPNTYFKYRDAEWKKGPAEAVKDPFYIATQYRRFSRLDAVPGLAVVGLSFVKPA